MLLFYISMAVLPVVEGLPLSPLSLVPRNPGSWSDASSMDYLVSSHPPRETDRVFKDLC